MLDADGRVVPGLYAAGRNAWGLPDHGYNSGLSLADARSSGEEGGWGMSVRYPRSRKTRRAIPDYHVLWIPFAARRPERDARRLS